MKEKCKHNIKNWQNEMLDEEVNMQNRKMRDNVSDDKNVFKLRAEIDELVCSSREKRDESDVEI